MTLFNVLTFVGVAKVSSIGMCQTLATHSIRSVNSEFTTTISCIGVGH